ncbi:hypothetical protein SynA1528_00491 [Synechococcus sp. A15-28]|nr:hypothetical protein SynA1528_00491 [Synechococcus sp. A15-28]
MSLHPGFFDAWKRQQVIPEDRSCTNGSDQDTRAVKNCYPGKNLGAMPVQDASAERKGTPPQRPVLTVVNKLRSRRSTPCPSL